ncbi:MAG: copper resistance protein CopC/CopD [Candidatus Rokubacteria bacterium]|nr:copper resistance protein CopC/CopD [Candidatus Rokubacteria bacterium]
MSADANETHPAPHTIRRLSALAVLAVLALLPLEAGAHAGPVAATPPPGLGLVQAPGAVVLRFSEPISHRLSRIDVLDQAWQDATTGPTAPVEGDPNAMQRKLGLLTPGQYTVRWTTVSTLDGHTLRGSYTFGIGTGSLGNQRIENDPVASEGWAGLIGRLSALGGLILWIGFGLLGGVAARAGTPEARLMVVGRAAPLLAATGTALSIVWPAFLAGGSLGGIIDVVLATRSGRLRALVVLAAGAAVVIGPRRFTVNRALAVAAALAEAASGHASSAAVPSLAVLSFAVHLVAAALWLFAIVAAALSSDRLLAALAAFSPFAIVGAALVGLSGVSSATLELGRVSDLWSTAYGQIVLAKATVFVAMATFGLAHHRLRRRPDARGTRVARPLGIELVAGVLALGLATVLVAFPNPPRELESAEPLARIDPVLARLEAREAVSVAGPSGAFLAGLTVLPPRPGPVELRLQLLGLEAGDAPRAVQVHGRSDGGGAFKASLVPCDRAFGCFVGRGYIDVPGVWRIGASMTSNRGPIRVETALTLPAVDGASELARAIASMERLRAARLREDLRGEAGQPPVLFDYRFRAPDAFEMKRDARLRIVVGERSYSRAGAAEPWTSQPWPGPPFTWPKSYYREFWRDARAVRILGVDKVDGVVSNVVGFVRPQLPAWFRLWVGREDGLVRRQEMLAEGHLMDHRYVGFDEPLDLRPPI